MHGRGLEVFEGLEFRPGNFVLSRAPSPGTVARGLDASSEWLAAIRWLAATVRPWHLGPTAIARGNPEMTSKNTSL